jgi:hypothetical protein
MGNTEKNIQLSFLFHFFRHEVEQYSQLLLTITPLVSTSVAHQAPSSNPVVNFTNILRTAFLPVGICQKNVQLNNVEVYSL